MVGNAQRAIGKHRQFYRGFNQAYTMYFKKNDSKIEKLFASFLHRALPHANGCRPFRTWNFCPEITTFLNGGHPPQGIRYEASIMKNP